MAYDNHATELWREAAKSNASRGHRHHVWIVYPHCDTLFESCTTLESAQLCAARLKLSLRNKDAAVIVTTSE